MFTIALITCLAGAPKVQPTVVPESKTKVRQPSATRGGAEAEPVESARRGLPKRLRHVARVLARIGEPTPTNALEAKLLDGVVASLKSGDTEGAKKQWSKAFAAYYERTKSKDVDLLLQAVIRRTYLQENASLKALADKVAYHNAAKAEIREEVKAVRRKIKALEPDQGLKLRKMQVRSTYVAGKQPVTRAAPRLLSRPEIGSYLQGLEEQSKSLGEDGQLFNIDLQNALQRQQQMLQMMASVSKLCHDTAMAIIRKID